MIITAEATLLKPPYCGSQSVFSLWKNLKYDLWLATCLFNCICQPADRPYRYQNLATKSDFNDLHPGVMEPRGGGGQGRCPPLFAPGVPFFRNESALLSWKVPYFHGIEVPFLQNSSALFGQCPLTFEVLLQPLS